MREDGGIGGHVAAGRRGWGSRPGMIRQPIRIGTRGSKLALAQAGAMRAAIAAA